MVDCDRANRLDLHDRSIIDENIELATKVPLECLHNCGSTIDGEYVRNDTDDFRAGSVGLCV